MRRECSFLFLVLVNNCIVKSTDLESFRRACPYNDFCTVSSLKTFNSSRDTQSCCFDCFCDEYSAAYGDSCPDYLHIGSSSVNEKTNDYKLECKALYYKGASKTEQMLIDDDMQFLRFIDFCPSNFNGNEVLRAKCMGNYFNQADFDDIVAVSNQNGVLFQNKFCARCHGEVNVTRWNLKILSCQENLDELQLAASELKDYVLQNCIVTSSRPTTVPLTSRTIDCRDFRLLCENRRVDKETEQACLNGPRMPIININQYRGITLFKNTFCANCDKAISEICPRLEDTRTKSVSRHAIDVLLDFPTIDTLTPGPSACKEFEKYDHQKGQCRRLYCPPLEVSNHGKCVPMTKQSSSFPLSVKLIYRPENVLDIPPKYEIHTLYNISITQHYLMSLKIEFQYPNCKIYKIMTYSYYGKMSKRFKFIIVDIMYEINQNCSLRNIGNKMRMNSIKKRYWLVHNQQIKMHGHITFFDTMFEPLPTEYDYYELFSTTPSLSHSVRNFFLCPYFVLNLDAINIEPKTQKVLSEMSLSGIQELTPISPYQNGVYPLSENRIAICFETNLSRSRAQINSFKTSCLLTLVVLNLNFVSN